MHQEVFQLLGGERVLGPSVRSNLDLVKATRDGLPSESAIELGKVLSLVGAGSSLGIAMLDVARVLTPTESDLVVRNANAIARATEVLGTRDKAVHWLQSPNRALGGECPISLLDTSAGEHEVEGLLERIEYGVYS